jgi:hypothetical protein
MGRIVSIHEYNLKPGVNVGHFEQALREAEARGLLQLPGLVAHHFVKGAKGVRRGAYAALLIYPRPSQEYPDSWRVWEEEVLAPFLGDHPDRIRFTADEELKGTADQSTA